MRKIHVFVERAARLEMLDDLADDVIGPRDLGHVLAARNRFR
jgi:hypothetical protein